MALAIYQRYTDYILGSATVSGTAPLTSYSLSTLTGLNPATRVRFGSGTVTVTFTLGSGARGDLFALPMHNLSGSVLTLTNGAGLSQAITLATLPADSLPRTTIVDLTIGTPNGATRTSTTWNLVIAGNAANVILGGAVWIGTTNRTLSRNFAIEPIRALTYQSDEVINPYGVAYAVDYETVLRSIRCEFAGASTQDRSDLEDWYRTSHGRVRPSIFWPDPSVNDAILGRWPETFEETLNRRGSAAHRVPLAEFRELSKGKPVF